MANLRRFFSLKQEHTKFFLIFGMIAAVGFISVYYPEYGLYSIYGAIGAIMLILVSLELSPYIYARGKLHIDLQVWTAGEPPTDRHFDVYLEKGADAAQPIIDVMTLIGLTPEQRKILQFLGGRYWYPYIAKLALFSISDFPQYGTIEYMTVKTIALLLPHPYTKFCKHTYRDFGAYFAGSQYNHPASVHLETILAPFTLPFFEDEIPICVGFSSSYTVSNITEGWNKTMNEVSRSLTYFDKIIEENHINIWPEKQLNEIGVNALDEAGRKFTLRQVREMEKEVSPS